MGLGNMPACWPVRRTAGYMAAYRGGAAGAGYRRDPSIARDEALFAGPVGQVEPLQPPLAGLSIQRATGRFGTRFTAQLDGQSVGDCDCISDLTDGGALPALRGWGELAELEVREGWRNRGIGTWL